MDKKVINYRILILSLTFPQKIEKMNKCRVRVLVLVCCKSETVRSPFGFVLMFNSLLERELRLLFFYSSRIYLMNQSLIITCAGLGLYHFFHSKQALMFNRKSVLYNFSKNESFLMASGLRGKWFLFAKIVKDSSLGLN